MTLTPFTLEFHCPKMRLVRWGVIAFHEGIIWSLPTCTLPSASLALCLTHASFLASPQRPNTKTSHFGFALPSFHYDRGMQACTHMCKITNKVMYAYVHHMWSCFKMIKKKIHAKQYEMIQRYCSYYMLTGSVSAQLEGNMAWWILRLQLWWPKWADVLHKKNTHGYTL